MNTTIRSVDSLKGHIRVPGDKSIAHRAVILNSIAEGRAIIENFPFSKDCLNTIYAMTTMGAKIDMDISKSRVTIEGRGLKGLSIPPHPIDVGNSGTTARLLIGLLAGQDFPSTITGDIYLCSRPMDRVISPISNMGASLDDGKRPGYLPIDIYPSKLHGIDYTLPIASAQVKSAILLATLYATSPTVIRGDRNSRNHTELMLKAMGADIAAKEKYICLTPTPSLCARDMYIPGDISSAAFFITAGLLVPNATIIIKDIGLNITRSGILDVYSDMGANIELENVVETAGELKGDIKVSSSSLTSTTIAGDIIPRLIDEIPIIALAATQANGTSIIKDAKELTVKESNRIQSTAHVLSKLGADIEPTSDGMIIKGPTPLYGNTVDCRGDHRIAMMASIAGLIASGETTIKNSQWIDISFPGYFDTLKTLSTFAL